MPPIKFAVMAIAAALIAAIIATGAGAGGPAAPTHLTIRHVQQGCHVWTQEGVQSTSLRLRLTIGARLHIVNRDIVAQELVQLKGPNLAPRGHMMPGKSELLAFRQPGIYQFKNKVIKMGAQASAKTNGPENTLRLTISVR